MLQQTLLDFRCLSLLDRNIPHGTSLETLRKRLNERETSRVPTEELIKMVDFMLKNNFFKFSGEVKKQRSGTTIGTKVAPPYACIFMNAVVTEFFTSHSIYNLFYGSVILTTYFLNRLMEKRNSFSFLMNFITSTLILHMKSQRTMLFFRFKCKPKRWCNAFRSMITNTSIISRPIPNTLNCQYHTFKH